MTGETAIQDGWETAIQDDWETAVQDDRGKVNYFLAFGLAFDLAIGFSADSVGASLLPPVS